jgi:hypothetical protein
VFCIIKFVVPRNIERCVIWLKLVPWPGLHHIMLRLHYVPGSHGSPLARNVVRREILVIFTSISKSWQVLLRSFTESVMGRRKKLPWSAGGSTAHYGSATYASTFPPGLLRSDRSPLISRVLKEFLYVSHVLSSLSTYETWTPGNYGSRLYQRRSPNQKQSLYHDLSKIKHHEFPRWRF